MAPAGSDEVRESSGRRPLLSPPEQESGKEQPFFCFPSLSTRNSREAHSIDLFSSLFPPSSVSLSLSLSQQERASFLSKNQIDQSEQPPSNSKQKVSFAEGGEAAVVVVEAEEAPGTSATPPAPQQQATIASESSSGKQPAASRSSLERPSMATRAGEVLRSTARESLAMLLEGNARFCSVRSRERERVFPLFFDFFFLVVPEVEVGKTSPGRDSLFLSLAAAQPSRFKALNNEDAGCSKKRL